MLSRETRMIVHPFAWFAKNGVPKENLSYIMEPAHHIKMATLRKRRRYQLGRSMCGGTLHRPVLGRLVFTVIVRLLIRTIRPFHCAPSASKDTFC